MAKITLMIYVNDFINEDGIIKVLQFREYPKNNKCWISNKSIYEFLTCKQFFDLYIRGEVIEIEKNVLKDNFTEMLETREQ